MEQNRSEDTDRDAILFTLIWKNLPSYRRTFPIKDNLKILN
ncbi:hypothetical protein CLOSYM_02462 [[Clostridium] symbiosum ATCC 14940]|uniref:Uncharacterized protein n=1 Tax=[Clostridium] symbiosum ATCC 14940 TaxID=411472 RepID=A0ABC9TXG3_CLOSY|nr:hypothetical protein CLOSYM_02462 [[Clostridium] symbiosum ATCC 14940]